MQAASFKVILTLSLSLFLSIATAIATVAENKTIPFGKGNELVIDQKSGLFSIKYHGKTIVSNAFSSFSANNAMYQSKDYTSYQIILKAISDSIGTGTKVTLTAKAVGKPTVLQYFYCYPDQEFFVTQLEIEGDALNSNYMAPLVSTQASIISGEDVRSLFVPFDNDTFISYDAKLLSAETHISAEVGAVYDNQSRNGLIIGSLDHMDWKTGIKTAGSKASLNQLEVWAGYSDVAVTRDSMEHGTIHGDIIRSPRIFVGYFADWRDGMDSYAQTGRLLEPPYIQPWKKATPVGWNSWGVIKEHLTYEQATGVADFFDKEIPQFRNADQTAFIDLDSFWDNMVSGGFSGDFSRLKDFVTYCKARGLEPGVYWAPFTDWGFRGNKDRIAEGGNYKFSDMWIKTTKGYHDLDGGRALDPTHPGTKARVAYVINKLKDCGFKMIKIDFLAHAAAEASSFFDPKITTGMQAYRVGMECLSDHLNNTMLVYAAISPSLATARYTHMRRIACDAWKSIKDTEYTLNSVNYGWWQTHLYDYIDADHLVFEQESLESNRARLISGLITGSVILGDDYSKEAPWQEHIKQWLQQPEIKPLLQSGKAFRPVEGNTDTKTSNLFVRHEKDGTYLAVFNFSTQAANIAIDVERIGLNPTKKYILTEILGGQAQTLDHQLSITFDTEGAYLYKIDSK